MQTLKLVTYLNWNYLSSVILQQLSSNMSLRDERLDTSHFYTRCHLRHEKCLPHSFQSSQLCNW